jgi:hypothetical protein
VTKYLAKANNDVLSFCTCEKPLAAGPSQLDCPWCGCGWLICCLDCGKAFVFAEVVDVDRTYDDIVGADFRRRGYDLPADEIEGLAQWMAEAMEPLHLGDVVVYLDGCYFPVHERDIASQAISRRTASVACRMPMRWRGRAPWPKRWARRLIGSSGNGLIARMSRSHGAS